MTHTIVARNREGGYYACERCNLDDSQAAGTSCEVAPEYRQQFRSVFGADYDNLSEGQQNALGRDLDAMLREEHFSSAWEAALELRSRLWGPQNLGSYASVLAQQDARARLDGMFANNAYC